MQEENGPVAGLGGGDVDVVVLEASGCGELGKGECHLDGFDVNSVGKQKRD